MTALACSFGMVCHQMFLAEAISAGITQMAITMQVTLFLVILLPYCKGHRTAKYLSYVMANKLKNDELKTKSLVCARIQHVSVDRYGLHPAQNEV